MQNLPKDIWDIASALEKERLSDWSDDRNQNEESTVELLQRLANAGDPATIPCAARFLFSSNHRLRKVAAGVVGQLIATISPCQLIDASGELSSPYRWGIYEDWRRLKPADVARLARDADSDGYLGVLGFLSFHHSGYVRHEALRHLAEIHDGGELPFLIVRQNDWVEPIAVEAQRAVCERIEEGYIHHIIRCLRLILHTQIMQRFDHRGSLRRVFELLCLPQFDSHLQSAVFSSDRKLRHGIIRHIFEHQNQHQLRVINFAIDSSDSAIRYRCCKQLSKVGKLEDFMAMQDRIAGDRFMSVRREALEQKARYLPDQAEAIWKEALYDSSRSIRELARFKLKQFGISEADIAEVYRAKLREQPELFAALQGLSEVGTANDIDVFRFYLHHRWPSRRAVAIDGMSRVQGDAAFVELLPRLREVSPCVVRAVRKAIGVEAYLIDAHELQLIGLEAPAFFSRKTVINLIFTLGKWKSIPLLLPLAASEDSMTAKYAETVVMRWFEYPHCVSVFTRASEQDKVDIKREISKYEGKISEDLLKHVEREIEMF